MPPSLSIIRDIDIWFDPASYSAFPHVISLGGDELLMTFRQAPVMPRIHHTHPRSVITVVRSYDRGRTWDMTNATQMAAGGGQELGVLHLGNGKIVGALAWHSVVHEREEKRSGLKTAEGHHRFGTPGTIWAWSDDYGLSWPPYQSKFLAGCSHESMPCAAPIRMRDGTLICPAYTFEGSNLTMDSIIFRSTDAGETWSKPIVIAPRHEGGGMCEPSVVETSPGKLLALHRAETPTWDKSRGFWMTRSGDGGLTWSRPKATGIQSGACPRLFNLAEGRVLLTFGRRFEPCGIYAAISDDAGETWSEPMLLRACPNSDQGYTSTVELSPGELFTASYMQNPTGITGIMGIFWRLS